MSAARWAVLAAIAGGVGLLTFHVLGGGDPAARREGAASSQLPLPVVERPLALTASAACRDCHPEVFAEWERSHHRMAYVNPVVQQLSEGFKNRDCLPCHLPRPVFETGLGVRVLERETRHEEGVDCFTCHQAGHAILGRGPISEPDAPCNPRAYAGIGSMDLCAPCHDQHKVHQEWRQTSFAVPGEGFKDCNHCHMPEVARERGAGRPGRTGRSHVFAAAHDPEMLRRAATVTAQAGGRGQVLVTVRNTGAGHNFPTDERHRAVDLDIELSGEGGESAVVRVDRYRNPYRHEFHIKNPLREPGATRSYALDAGDLGEVQVEAVRVPAAFNPRRETAYPESTQIPAGEARSYTLRLPPGVREVVVRLYYRTNPFEPDTEAALLAEIPVRP